MQLPRFLMGWEKLGIKCSDLVLEVGSDNRPAARSDVLCDLGDYGQMARYGGDLLNDTAIVRSISKLKAPFHFHITSNQTTVM